MIVGIYEFWDIVGIWGSVKIPRFVSEKIGCFSPDIHISKFKASLPHDETCMADFQEIRVLAHGLKASWCCMKDILNIVFRGGRRRRL